MGGIDPTLANIQSTGLFKAKTGPLEAAQGPVESPIVTDVESGIQYLETPIEKSKAEASGLSLPAVGGGAIKPEAAGDLLPPTSGGPASLNLDKVEDQNRFNVMQQVFNMKNQAASAVGGEGEVDISSQATGKAKKADAPKKKKKGGFLSKLKNLVAKVLPVLSLVSMFVPGLQVVSMALKVAQMATKAIELAEALKNGNWKSALGAIAGAASGMGGALGEVAKWGAKGVEVLGAVEKGGLAGGLGALGGMVGGDVGKYMNMGAKAVGAIENKDPMALIGAIGGDDGLGKILDQKTMGVLNDAVTVANGVLKKDAGELLKGMGNLTGSPELQQLGPVVDAFNNGGFDAAVGALNKSGVLPENVSKTLGDTLPAATKAFKAASSEDWGQFNDAFKGFFDTDTGKAVQEAVNEQASDAVNSMLGLANV
ncbi:hypothetical protein J7643_01880 [bacterium]|nr:hypothetical protein [bacterium]